MKTIISILKKSLLPILFVIVLLFIQAMCDLALPDYTAKIVNVGIQQNGIENAVFKVIRKSEMEKILLLVSDEDANKILDKYNLEKSNDYPSIKEDIYVLKDINSVENEELNNILNKPLAIIAMITSDSFDTKPIKEEIIKQFPSGSVNFEIDFFELLKMLPSEQLSVLLKEFGGKFDELEPVLVEQISIAYVKEEYKIIKLDIEDMQLKYITNAGLKMLGIALIIMVITCITTYLSSQIGAKFSRTLRSKVVNKVMSFSNKEFEEFSTASLITRTTNDIQQIQLLITMMLRIIIYAPIIGIGAFIKVSNSSMSWVIGLVIGLILILILTLFIFALPKFTMVQKLIDKLNLVAREILTGLPVIRAFSTEKYEEKRFDKANKDLTKVNLFVNRVMVILMPTMMFIMNGVSILIIWVGADKIDAGTMQVGTLLAFITYTMQIIIAFLMIAMMSIFIPRAWVSVRRIAEIFNKDNSIKESNNPQKFNNQKRGVVEFKDVYFRYPDAEEDVLENISFKAVPGTTTAFIGSTGCGKSTLINLIPRFFDVTGGKILIDGVNIKNVKLHDLRAKIGYVPQKGVLFSGTIKSNIGFGKKNIKDEEVENAARISQSLEFIQSKDEQYNSKISQGGSNVSGGQKQRLAIARAIATNPDIYIFDDSFSALDFKTDAKLRKALAKETKNSTIFIVAQRISTVLNADQIIVLDSGKIVGIGTHEELMKQCNVYQEIALSQLSKEELAYEE